MDRFGSNTRYLSESRGPIVPFEQMPSQALTVNPSKIKFDGLSPGILYIMTFSVRNNSLNSQRIRITAPNTKYFALNYVPSGVVAPGLDVRAEIECQLPAKTLLDQFVFHDKITVIMGDYKVDIPIVATRPAASIQFNKLANFGFIAEGNVSRVYVDFSNYGVQEATLKLKSLANESILKIEPADFTLHSNETRKIMFEVQCDDLGEYREAVMVEVIGGVENNLILDVVAQVVTQKLTLLSTENGASLDSIAFGGLYYGQRKEIHALLVNSGPKQLSFSVSYADEDDGRGGASIVSPASDDQIDLSTLPIEKFMNILPSDGVVNAFSQLPIVIRFIPEMPVVTKGFSKQLTMDTKDLRSAIRRAFIESSEIGQRLQITMEGAASLPNITVSPTTLKFGSCSVNERRDITLTVRNESKVSTSFEFKKIAHFKISPMKASLKANDSMSVIVSFIPSQMGKFKLAIPMNIADGLSKLELKLVAEAFDIKGKKMLIGGIDKVPADFESKYDFVNPTKVSSERKRQLAIAQGLIVDDKEDFDLQSGSSSKDRDGVYGFISSKDMSLVESLDSNHPLTLRRANDKYYNTYLQNSYNKRVGQNELTVKLRILEKGGIDRADPSGIDMGMERGLDEPALATPKAGEPLWLSNRPGGGSVRRLPTDENRLIQKKFSPTPSTQAEMRDCSTELSIDQLKQVYGSHKVLDFGKVCVNSVVIKNFVVTNELSHSVLVKIMDLEMESRQSKPGAQVIPAGLTAGFDVYFTHKSLGKYRKTFTWTVNTHHIFKVTLIADVVPIELVMSKNNIQLEFANDSLETSSSKDIVITNPGNAVAEFLWGNSGSFVCQPDKGSINPGQAAIISVIWTPVYGRRNEEELGLHVSGGIDQTLTVSGRIDEGKCVFEAKEVKVGTIAVGTEKTFETFIKNVGTCPAVFIFDSVDEKLGLTINPLRGILSQGESAAIEFQFAPRTAISYENTKISCAIRSGKSTAIKLTGEVVVPQIELIEEQFDMGVVVTGTQAVSPITFKNHSAIAASVVMDLSLHGEFKPCIHRDNDDPSLVAPAIQEDAHGNSIQIWNEHGSNDENAAVSGKKPSKKGSKYRITLAAGATLTGALLFNSFLIRAHQFKIPIYLFGMQEQSYNRDVCAQVIGSRISISTPVVRFGDRVVARDAMARSTYFLEFTISNLDSRGLTFDLREPDSAVPVTIDFDNIKAKRTMSMDQKDSVVAPPLFFAAPTKASLGPGMSSSIRVSFSPQIAGDFSKRFEVYISDQPDQTRPYTVIMLKGSGVFPRLTFSDNTVTLPTVPLGVCSRAIFSVYNSGYTSLELKYRVSPTITVPLDVLFPDGTQIGSSCETVRVLVSARSNVPTSWTGKIEFYDTDGERFCINVAGCADGSIITAYNFVKAYSSSYGFVGLESKPVQMLSRPEISLLMQQEARRKEELRKQRSLELQKASGATADEKKKKGKDGDAESKGSAAKMDDMPLNIGIDSNIDGIDLHAQDSNDRMKEFDEQECITLIKWLNKFIVRKPFDANRFPDCICETQGDLVVDFIEQVSGQRIQGIKDENTRSTPVSRGRSANAQANKDSQGSVALQLVAKYKTMLEFLIRGGCLVNHIDPISLLGLPDYLMANESELRRTEGSRCTASMIHERTKVWTDSWQLNCTTCWLEILFQIFKVYSLSRVNYKAYSNCPGVLVHAPHDTTSGGESKEDGGKKKGKKVPLFPGEFAPSNIFSHSESTLMQWASYHIQRCSKLKDEGATTVDRSAISLRRVTDVDTQLVDLYAICQIIHSHIPDTTLPGGPLSGYTVSADKHTAEGNYRRIKIFFEAYRLDFDVNETDLVASGRTIMLLLLHLYLNLPYLIPKMKVEFRGNLGVPIVKTIELKNPSKKKISYIIHLQGSSDFHINSHEVVIMPESTVDYPISVHAKFAEPANALISFIGVREQGVAGSTLVFQLESNIVGRKAVETVKNSIAVFEHEIVTLNVSNPLSSTRDSTFTVKTLVAHNAYSISDAISGKPMPAGVRPKVEPKVIDPDEELKEEKKDNKRGKGGDKDDDDSNIEDVYNVPYWIKEETVTIPAGKSVPLNVNVLPFVLGTYSCQIVFNDPSMGEFCYEIQTEVKLPEASDTCKFEGILAKGTSSMRMAFRIASKNSCFEKAMTMVLDNRYSNPQKKAKLRTVLQNLLSAPVQDDSTGQSQFLIEILSPYLSCPKAIPVVSEYQSSSLTVSSGTARPTTQSKYKKCLKSCLESLTPAEASLPFALNAAFLTFQPEKAGVYKCKAVVYSKDNRHDVRVFDIACTAVLPDVKLAIEFNCAARQPVTQDIPIQNESNNDWNLTASVSGRGFSGPKNISIPRGSRGLYPLQFIGPSEGMFEGSLVLSNSEQHDSFDYALTGVCEEPLAEAHLKYKCNARLKQSYSINLHQLGRPAIKGDSKEKKEAAALIPPQYYSVQTDIQYLIGGSEIAVPATGADYIFSIFSPVSGVITGSITFTDTNTGAMQWYTVEIEITAPQAESTIAVESYVRKAVAVEISLVNPTKETLEFNVNLEGDGLIGDAAYSLAPQQSNKPQMPYELIYSPLVGGASTGRISFINDAVGEFWYSVALTALPSPPTVVDTIDCMVGSAKVIEIPVENPLSDPVTLTLNIIDNDHFSSVSDTITLEAFAQSSFNISFRPSSINELVSSDIFLSAPSFGTIHYKVTGIGSLPGIMPTVYMSSPLGEINSHAVMFRNPFPFPLPVDIVLTDEAAVAATPFNIEYKKMFELLMRKTSLVVPPKAPCQISMSFAPSKLGQFNALVQVRSSISGRSLLWAFPIVAIAEAGSLQKLERLETPCKTSILREVDVKLEGLKKEDLLPGEVLSLSKFSQSLNYDDAQAMLINRSFRATPIDIIELSEEEAAIQNTSFIIRYRLLFEPLRVFVSTIEMILECKNHGRWRIKVDVEALEPEPDDVVNLVASVGETDKVSFRLSNRFLGYSNFQAYFSARSSPNFTITPPTGVLAPFGSEGTQFVVTFSPVEYGSIERAQLTIRTDETQWNYDVTGSYPRYDINDKEIRAKTDSGLSHSVMHAPTNSWFVAFNYSIGRVLVVGSPEQESVAGGSSDIYHKMDVNNFIAAVEMDDELIQAILRKTRLGLQNKNFLKHCD